MNALFVWIPRTGGLSVFDALKKHGARKHLRLGIGPLPQEGIVTYGHMSVQQLVSRGYVGKDFYDRAFKFCFVRNPYDRAVSLWAYFNRFGSKRADICGFRCQDAPFHEFCYRLKEGIPPIGPYNKDGLSQANPQVAWMRGIRFDYIGHFDSLQSDMTVIMAHLGLPREPIKHRNKSEHADYRSYYDAECQQIVREFYREDFETLGYGEEL